MANTLAYYDTATVTAVKRFIVQAPGIQTVKLFKAVINFLAWLDGVFTCLKIFYLRNLFHSSIALCCIYARNLFKALINFLAW